MFALIPLLASLIAGPTPTENKGALVLRESMAGVTLTVPVSWSLSTGAQGLMAFSEGSRGSVLLAPVKKGREEIGDVARTLIFARLDDVFMSRTTVEGVEEGGVLEAIVAASGSGKSREDGETVEFAAFAIKSRGDSRLVLGTWKDEAHKKLVTDALAGISVERPARKGGLEITNTQTGSRVMIPAGWKLVRNPKGLLVKSSSNKAMAVLMNWQDDFEASLGKMREDLLSSVFMDVQLGDFTAADGMYDASLGRTVTADGTAIDRHDEQPVDFKVVRIQQVEEDKGALFFGAWKDEKHATLIAELLASVRVMDPEAMKK